MEAKRLMKVTYQDLKKGIRLNAYADAVIWSEDPSPTLAGLRFGGYAEVVRGLTDAIYGGATIEIEDADGSLLTLKSLSKQYHREVSHEGLYAEATLIAEDEIQESSKSQDEKSSKHAQKDDLFDDNVPQQDIPAHICYIFCHPGNEDELFQAIDQKSYVPMIPEYQDYVLAELKRRRILRPLRVRSLYQELEAWKLCCEAKDQNLVKVMEDGLKQGKIKIPGAAPGPSLLDGVHSVTDYLNTFGVAVAERIKKLFVPLFDPATEPLSEEVLDINEYTMRSTEKSAAFQTRLATTPPPMPGNSAPMKMPRRISTHKCRSGQGPHTTRPLTVPAASSWKMPAFEPYLTREFRFRTLCCRLPPAGSGSGFDKI